MAKRLYNGVYDSITSDNNETVHRVENSCVIDKDYREEVIEKTSQHFFKYKTVIILFLGLFMVFGLFVSVACFNYAENIKFGGSTSQESIIGFITCLISDNNDAMFTYIPKEIRNSGILIDTEGISDLQKTDEMFHISFTSITINDCVELTDLKSIMNNIKSQYQIDMNITDAMAFSILAKYTYKDGIETKNGEFLADLISIKIHDKWYICPGLTIPDGIFKDTVVETETKVNASYDDNKNVDSISVNTLNYISPVDKTIPDIEPYSGALKDLQMGKVTIDEKDYVLPCPYLEMTDIFTLSYGKDVTSLDSLTIKTSIKPNYILNNLPAVFSNLNYNMADLSVSIGNRTKENIYVDAGDITMLYIGIPKSPYSYQIYDYPTILLPGSVSLGTSFIDVEQTYGKLTKCEDRSNVVLYDVEADIYAIPMGNSHNFIYFQFLDNKLAAIQWYYYDFNVYNS